MMKIQIKANELVNILIQKYDTALLKKYDLDSDKIGKLQQSLKDGNWRFIS